MAVIGFIPGWWGAMIGVICLVVAALFYLVAYFNGLHTIGQPLGPPVVISGSNNNTQQRSNTNANSQDPNPQNPNQDAAAVAV